MSSASIPRRGKDKDSAHGSGTGLGLQDGRMKISMASVCPGSPKAVTIFLVISFVEHTVIIYMGPGKDSVCSDRHNPESLAAIEMCVFLSFLAYVQTVPSQV